jgi:hypothetical protein
MAEKQVGHRILNDVHGLMVFECEPWPRFLGGSLTLSVGRDAGDLRDAIAAALDRTAVMSGRERLAYDLYSASFAETSADARFVMLMMAAETLIEPLARVAEVVTHVERLLALTREARLPTSETASLSGSLKWLKSESISQAGRRLAKTLGARLYMEETPPRFFTRCYQIRSQLVHGGYPRLPMQTVNSRSAALEQFVGDLLSKELL